MTTESESPTVRIAVQQPPDDSEKDKSLRDGPVLQTPDYTIIVPITEELLEPDTGINVRRLLQTAFALAEDNDGRVLLVGIVTVTDDSALETVREYRDSNAKQETDADVQDVVEFIEERRSQLARILDVGQGLEPDVSVSATVRAVVNATHGILDILEDSTEMAVLLLRGTSLDERTILARSTIDTVLAEAECDVFVENLGTQGGENALYIPDIDEHTVASLAESESETIDSVLLPVGNGPHSALAAEAARAVATAADSSVTVLHVIEPNASGKTESEASDILKFAEYVLGSDLTVDAEIRKAADTTDEIVGEAQNHDFTVIGAPEQKSRLERLVFESVQQTLTHRSDVTVLMARDSDRTARSLYYRWKQGLDAMEDNNGTD